MRTKYFFFLFFLLSHFAFSQDFETIKDQEITNGNYDLIFSHITSFEGNDFDSLDIKIFQNSPFIGTILVELANEKNTITYMDLYNRLLDLKQNEIYPKLRKQRIAMTKLETKLVVYSEWDEAEVILHDIGMEKDQIDSFKVYVKESTDTTITYLELLPKFYQEWKKEQSENQKREKKEWEKLFLKSIAIEEDSLIKVSREENKPLLFYFTGHSCVNSRRLEQSVLLDPEIIHLLMNDFIFVPLFVDDRTELPSGEKKEVELNDKKRKIETIGEKNMYYQVSRFNESMQPYFVILDSKNEVIDTADYNVNTERLFLQFLEKSLEKIDIN